MSVDGCTTVAKDEEANINPTDYLCPVIDPVLYENFMAAPKEEFEDNLSQAQTDRSPTVTASPSSDSHHTQSRTLLYTNPEVLARIHRLPYTAATICAMTRAVLQQALKRRYLSRVQRRIIKFIRKQGVRKRLALYRRRVYDAQSKANDSDRLNIVVDSRDMEVHEEEIHPEDESRAGLSNWQNTAVDSPELEYNADTVIHPPDEDTVMVKTEVAVDDFPIPKFGPKKPRQFEACPNHTCPEIVPRRSLNKHIRESHMPRNQGRAGLSNRQNTVVDARDMKANEGTVDHPVDGDTVMVKTEQAIDDYPIPKYGPKKPRKFEACPMCPEIVPLRSLKKHIRESHMPRNQSRVSVSNWQNTVVDSRDMEVNGETATHPEDGDTVMVKTEVHIDGYPIPKYGPKKPRQFEACPNHMCDEIVPRRSLNKHVRETHAPRSTVIVKSEDCDGVAEPISSEYLRWRPRQFEACPYHECAAILPPRSMKKHERECHTTDNQSVVSREYDAAMNDFGEPSNLMIDRGESTGPSQVESEKDNRRYDEAEEAKATSAASVRRRSTAEEQARHLKVARIEEAIKKRVEEESRRTSVVSHQDDAMNDFGEPSDLIDRGESTGPSQVESEKDNRRYDEAEEAKATSAASVRRRSTAEEQARHLKVARIEEAIKKRVEEESRRTSAVNPHHYDAKNDFGEPTNVMDRGQSTGSSPIEKEEHKQRCDATEAQADQLQSTSKQAEAPLAASEAWRLVAAEIQARRLAVVRKEEAIRRVAEDESRRTSAENPHYDAMNDFEEPSNLMERGVSTGPSQVEREKKKQRCDEIEARADELQSTSKQAEATLAASVRRRSTAEEQARHLKVVQIEEAIRRVAEESRRKSAENPHYDAMNDFGEPSNVMMDSGESTRTSQVESEKNKPRCDEIEAQADQLQSTSKQAEATLAASEDWRLVAAEIQARRLALARNEEAIKRVEEEWKRKSAVNPHYDSMDGFDEPSKLMDCGESTGPSLVESEKYRRRCDEEEAIADQLQSTSKQAEASLAASETRRLVAADIQARRLAVARNEEAIKVAEEWKRKSAVNPHHYDAKNDFGDPTNVMDQFTGPSQIDKEEHKQRCDEAEAQADQLQSTSKQAEATLAASEARRLVAAEIQARRLAVARNEEAIKKRVEEQWQRKSTVNPHYDSMDGFDEPSKLRDCGESTVASQVESENYNRRCDETEARADQRQWRVEQAEATLDASVRRRATAEDQARRLSVARIEEAIKKRVEEESRRTSVVNPHDAMNDFGEPSNLMDCGESTGPSQVESEKYRRRCDESEARADQLQLRAEQAQATLAASESRRLVAAEIQPRRLAVAPNEEAIKVTEEWKRKSAVNPHHYDAKNDYGEPTNVMYRGESTVASQVEKDKRKQRCDEAEARADQLQSTSKQAEATLTASEARRLIAAEVQARRLAMARNEEAIKRVAEEWRQRKDAVMAEPTEQVVDSEPMSNTQCGSWNARQKTKASNADVDEASVPVRSLEMQRHHPEAIADHSYSMNDPEEPRNLIENGESAGPDQAGMTVVVKTEEFMYDGALPPDRRGKPRWYEACPDRECTSIVSARSLNKHLREMHPLTVLDCGICGERVLDMGKHMKTHKQDTTHECALCGEQVTKRLTKKHIQEYHAELNEKTCNICDEFVTRSLGGFFRHQKACVERNPALFNHPKLISPVHCPMCDHREPSAYSVSKHLKMVHQAVGGKSANYKPVMKPFRCSACPYPMYSRASDLAEHWIVDDTNGKPCGGHVQMITKELAEFKMMQHETKLLQSKIGAAHNNGQSADQNGQSAPPPQRAKMDPAIKHAAAAAGRPKQSCAECGEEVGKKAMLAHLRNAHPEESVCDKCGEWVAVREMEKHVRDEHGEPSWLVCSHCEEVSFRNPDFALSHEQKCRLRPAYFFAHRLLLIALTCPFCQITERNAYQMTRHLATAHHNVQYDTGNGLYHTERPFRCSACPAHHYKQASRLAEHWVGLHRRGSPCGGVLQFISPAEASRLEHKH